MSKEDRWTRVALAKNAMRGALANKVGKPLETLSPKIESLSAGDAALYGVATAIPWPTDPTVSASGNTDTKISGPSISSMSPIWEAPFYGSPICY